MDNIRILIVDDQKMVREGLKLILEKYNRFEFVGEASNGFEAITLAKKTLPDVILMDLRMPEMNGIDATYRIKKQYPDMKILVLTTFNEQDLILKALQNGANGYVLKDIGSEEIVKAIDTVLTGHIMLQPEVTSELVKSMTAQKPDVSDERLEQIQQLTAKEREVASLISQGKTNKEIAAQLEIKEGTVKNHVSSILLKCELGNRTEIAMTFKSLKF